MILRNAAVRHGRRSLALPVSKAALRQLSTETSTTSSNGASPPQIPGQAGEPNAISSTSKASKTRASILQRGVTLSTDSAHEHSTPAWTREHRLGTSGDMLTPAQQFREFERVQVATKKLGSRVERRYVPTELITNPPGPEDVTLELLMASQTHMGHNTSLWNPANSRYIYGVRQGIHIISLETTAAHLRRAARVVEEVSYRGGIVLFVGTRNGQMEIVTKAAEMAGACYLFTKWTPGAITNRDIILASRSAKVVNHMDKELRDFEGYLMSARPLVPDLIVCLNPLENYTMLYECGLKNVPTIGIIDTNADPSWVTYTVPANDDSLRSVGVIGGVLGRAGQAGQKRRLKDAADGIIPWNTASEIKRHMHHEIGEAMVKRKEVMGKMQDQLQSFTEDEQKLLNSRFSGADPQEVSHADIVEMMGATVSTGGGQATIGGAAGEAAMAAKPDDSEALGKMSEVEAEMQLIKNAVDGIEKAVSQPR